MLISGSQIRLKATERRLLVHLTRSDVSHIRTREQLELFVKAHLVNYPGRFAEEILLRQMLEKFLSL
jgi:hypothetical protein